MRDVEVTSSPHCQDHCESSGRLPKKRLFETSVNTPNSQHAFENHDFTLSTRSRKSCCSEHDPPPHWFTVEIPPIVLHLLGTFLALLAGFFLSVGGLAIGKIRTLKPLEISGLRSLLACVYLTPLLLYFRPKHDFGKKMMLETLGVSFVFCVKFVTFSVGSTLLPLSEFSLLCNTVPVFTAFLGCLLLSEKCGFREWMSCLIVMLGVATTFLPRMIGGPPMTEAEAALKTEATEGYIVTAVSALSNAMALCWLRRLKEVHSLLVSFYACAITAIVSMGLSFLFGGYRPPTDMRDLLFVALAAFCMLCQALLPAIACSLTQASRVAVAMTFSVVFAFLLEAIFEGVQPSVYALAGGGLIVLAMVVGNSPCGDEDDQGLLKEEDGLSRNSRYGSMSAAMDNVR
ncbi:uncharacterized protein LOC100907856 [Galendromus occidentalis]|uniref:Uncharacterized protein LOC100907856 n=1 Tax=Galendromus occidentalis TaxID=34638 RepID=A0AAJ6VYT8_9ACAR|nr:uncharacterized protein LOC100907856 [Galendromus occidentalis]